MSQPQQHWKPLQPELEQNLFGSVGGGSRRAVGSGAPGGNGAVKTSPQQQQQSMFQNFPNPGSSSGFGNGFSSSGGGGGGTGFGNGGGGGGFGSPSSNGGGFQRGGGGGGGGLGQLSPGNGGSVGSAFGRPSFEGNGYGMGSSSSSRMMEARLSPNFSSYNGGGSQQQQHSPPLFGGGGGGGGGMRMNSSSGGFSDFSVSNGGGGGGNGSRFQNFDAPQRSGGSAMNNGYDSGMMMRGGGGGGGGGGSNYERSFDRSMSTANFEGGNGGFRSMSTVTNGYDRQMSAPNLRQQHNGYGGRGSMGPGSPPMGMHGGGGNDYGNSRYGGRNTSPIGGGMYGGGGGGNEMKIGTWNEGGGGNGGNNSSSMATFEIGTFNAGNPSDSGYGGGGGGHSSSSSNHFHSQSGNNIQGGPGIRETGIIEKLLHSYGFIQCCDRQARLFFHFSQFDGNIEHLKIGDPVEFEMTYDRRTGKPIASMVNKIAPEVVMSEERVIGTVTTEIKTDPETKQESQGRISYENRGECFFLPFTQGDVEGNVTLAPGDKVSFQMATMARSGTLVARTIRLENPAAPVKYQGVINSLKESFGFIERADVVREIFFHVSEMEESGEPRLGDDVEFTIQTRNGKEVACSITILPQGTVVFEDVGTEFFKGQVLKPLDKKYAANAAAAAAGGASPQGAASSPSTEGEVLNGRVKYRGPDRSEEEVQFGEKDQVGDFTLKHGDWVRFVIAVDRRDKLKRATKIELMEESFQVSDERREQGTIHALKDGFGFLKCAERVPRIFFHFSEVLDVNRTLATGDEVEFTISNDPNNEKKQLAIRIKHLEPGTVTFDVVIHKEVRGSVDKEPAANASWANKEAAGQSGSGSSGSGEKEGNDGAGRILYELNGQSLEIPLHAADCDLRNFPHAGDIVKFDINQNKATKETNAVNVTILETKHKKAPPQQPQPSSAPEGSGSSGGGRASSTLHHGYIAAIKDGFGFLETLTHDKEIFFHFSNVNGKAERLEVGQEVEYAVYNREKGGKLSAEGVRALEKGTIPAHTALPDVYTGKVVRPLRSVNPDQEEYCGLIQLCKGEGDEGPQPNFQFGIASLSNKKELLQADDPVTFQVSASEPKFAVCVKSTRVKQRAFVEALKGDFGFLSFEAEEGKKLFFHLTEVEAGDTLMQGDEVEFVVATNKRNGKHSACCVRKISSSKRPDRLISKLKTMNLEDGKRVVAVRAPKGPDGTKGFKAARHVASQA